MNRVLSAVFFFLSGFFPRNRRKALFGAWLGKRFSDNPKYLLLYLARSGSDLQLVWIGEEPVRASIPASLPVRFVRRGSWRAAWEQLTAGSCFVTHGFTDLGSFNLTRGARRVYLGHGLAIKHMGARDSVLPNRFFAGPRRLQRNVYAYDYYIASSAAHREKLLVENATCNISTEQVLNCGQPRIDFLMENFAPERVTALRAKLFEALGAGSPGKVITYLPTFRDKGNSTFSFAKLEPVDRERLDALLERWDAVILEKSHFADTMRGGHGNAVKSERVFLLGGPLGIDTQELLLGTDILVTDYSGCYVDFLVLRRPILHFAYDRRYYENADRGLYFNLDEVAGGPVVSSFIELCLRIEDFLRDPSVWRADRERVCAQLVEWEHGDACRIIARTVLDHDMNTAS